MKWAVRVTYCRPLGYYYITLQTWFVTIVFICVQTLQRKEAYPLPGIKAVLTRNLLGVSKEWSTSIFRVVQEVSFFYNYPED
jgi:hypothetical protein